jgi:hypothetical protein
MEKKKKHEQGLIAMLQGKNEINKKKYIKKEMEGKKKKTTGKGKETK